MMEAITLERIFAVGQLDRALEDLMNYCAQTKRDGVSLVKDPLVRQKLAGLATMVELSRVLGHQIVCMLDQGKVPASEGSVLKVFISEVEQKLASVALSIMGLHGQLEPGSKYAPLNGWLEHWFLTNTRRSIAGGTNEIQRNIIAQHGLGLPR